MFPQSMLLMRVSSRPVLTYCALVFSGLHTSYQVRSKGEGPSVMHTANYVDTLNCRVQAEPQYHGVVPIERNVQQVAALLHT